MKQKLKQALSLREKQRIADPSRTPAAVLLPIYYRQGQYYILFIKRTEWVEKHKGEISFPGGAREERDKTLLDTALRECAEEIGLMPDKVEILGELDDVVSVKTNYIISPFVALIPWPYQFKVDGKETEEIIEVPLLALQDKGYSHQVTRGNEMVTTYFYDYQGRVIWGATARILNRFLEIFTQAVRDSS
ncbi:MAG: NUDIX hydrolase [Dehalococcoidales bacterium]